jgi:sugar lactone lactonase YvrE
VTNSFLAYAAAIAVAASALPAQAPSGIPSVDSASVARDAWTRAVQSLQHNDTSAARFEISHAATAWPNQPAYLWADALLAVRAHDSTAAFRALRRYAALGLGRDVGGDASFAWMRESRSFDALRATLDSNRRVIAASHVRATLDDSIFWPEGMDYDAQTNRFYVASVRHGYIAAVAADGTIRRITLSSDKPIAPTLAVRVDTTRDVLWVTTSNVAAVPEIDGRAALLRVRIRDGFVERRWDVAPASAGHTLGDLAVGPRGDVFVTDSNDPVLYRLRPNADSLESIRSPLFHSLQGLAPSPNGRWLFLADYSHGLLRVDLATGTVTRLGDAANSTSLGCDGLAWDRGGIIAVQNGVSPARIVRFALNAAGDRIDRVDVLDQNWPIADEPTIGAIAGSEFVYVANSQWEKFEDGRRIEARPLTSPVLLAVPLVRP